MEVSKAGVGKGRGRGEAEPFVVHLQRELGSVPANTCPATEEVTTQDWSSSGLVGELSRNTLLPGSQSHTRPPPLPPPPPPHKGDLLVSRQRCVMGNFSYQVDTFYNHLGRGIAYIGLSVGIYIYGWVGGC